MNAEKQTVLVAMSGGVDSSVAAGLLLEQGYNVVGITLLFRPCDDTQNASWCCGRGAAENARAVCQTLGIKHYAIDCAAEFEAAVLRPAWEEYRSGRTPSPCIHCNTHIKFAILVERARALGAAFIATGHYAIVTHGDTPTLLRGEFAPKDQTYFLFALGKDALNHTLFPLGTLSKAEVRELAARWGFVNAKRPESQDACFVTEEGSFAEALRERFGAPKNEGPVVDEQGASLGRHGGIHNYTVGQRRGLRVALGQKAYVSRIDPVANTIVLSCDERSLQSRALVANDIKWTGDVAPSFPLRCEAQIRYRSAPAAAVVTIDGDRLKVTFDVPQKAISPGQAVVLFNGRQVLGGAWISQAVKEEVG